MVNSHLVCDPTIQQPGFDLPRQQWSLLNRFRTEQGHCGACRKKWRLTLICVLVVRPRRCLTLSNPVPWQNWMAAYLGYTLRMKTLFRGWPVMAHEMQTKRRMAGGVRQLLTCYRQTILKALVVYCSRLSVCPWNQCIEALYRTPGNMLYECAPENDEYAAQTWYWGFDLYTGLAFWSLFQPQRRGSTYMRV